MTAPTQAHQQQPASARARAGVQTANIPGELKMLPQWVTWVWKGQPDPKTGKRSKMPLDPKTGQAASSTDPATWATFDQAVLTYRRQSHAGIGFVFSASDPYVGVDLDGCINTDGTMQQWALDVLQDLNSYAELSPSGTGVHIIATGAIPSAAKTSHIEMYATGRFFTMTGAQIPGTPSAITDASIELLRLHNKLKPPPPPSRPISHQPIVASDPRAQAWAQRVIDFACDTMRQATQGTKHHTRVSMGRMLGGLVAHGLLSSQDAADLIYHANPPQANDASERKAIMDGVRLGTQTPLDPPPLPASQAPLLVDGHACCPLHLTPLRQSDTAGWFCPSPDAGGWCQFWFDGQGYTPPTAQPTSPPSSQPAPQYPPVSLDDVPPMPPEDTVKACFDDDESGDARLLCALYKDRLAYDSQLDRWHAWQGRYWVGEDVGFVRVLIEAHVGGAYLNRAVKLSNDAAREPDQQRRQELLKLSHDYQKRARSLHKLTRLNNIVTLSQHWLRVKGNIWDADPYKLAVENGVIDLTTGQLLSPDPTMYIRRVAPTTWRDLQTLAPRWEQFLAELFEPGSDYAEIPGYLQRLFGYSLIGLVRDRVLAVFWGQRGQNGKGTMLQTLRRVLGDYAGPVPRELMIDSGKGSNANAPAPQWLELQGKRLVWGSETDAGARVAMGAAKFLSGGDEISARPIHGKEYIKFAPSHHFVLLTNHKPKAQSDDDGFWLRLQLVPFVFSFVTADKATGAAHERPADITLEDTLVTEAPGILAWLVRGCLEYQRVGIQPPEIVKSATEEYRNDEDSLKIFIDETCIENPMMQTGAQDLFNAYKDWATESGINHPMKRPDFYKQMDARYTKLSTNTGKRYLGLALIVPPTGATP